jgi:tripartite motif-containing protein 71
MKWNIGTRLAGFFCTSVISFSSLHGDDMESYVFVNKWPEPPRGWDFSKPCAVACDGWGNAYVADTGNDRILKLSPDGALLAEWGAQGSGEGQFRSPRGVAADPFGDIYVADSLQ